MEMVLLILNFILYIPTLLWKDSGDANINTMPTPLLLVLE